MQSIKPSMVSMGKHFLQHNLFRRRKAVVFLRVNFFMNSAKTEWIAMEPNKRVGLKLTFPSPNSCEQCLKYLTTDMNVTVVTPSSSSETKGLKELVILPHQSPAETIQEILTDLKKNDNQNYTILKHMRRPCRTIVEFGSPNIAKPLHMGHLRSAVTGHYVARILKAFHHDVRQFCFLGDWGTQFGLLQAGLAEAHPGKPLDQIVESMSIPDLLDYYVKATKKEKEDPSFASEARRHCAALELGDSTSFGMWSKVRQKSVDHLDAMWKELGITYDVTQGESDYTMNSEHTRRALALLEESGILQTGPDGTKFVLVKLSEKSKKPSRATLIKSDGSSLYMLRDIAAAIHRKLEHEFDRMIYVVDTTQGSHFSALFDILRQINLTFPSSPSAEEGPAFQHVSFGRVGGQSTRSGTFSLLSDVIRDGTDMMDVNRASSPNTRYLDDRSISKQLAISALIINSLKVRRNKDIEFNWEQALQSHGDTGVNLQYCHARLTSLIMKQSDEYVDSSSGELKYKVDYEYILTDPVALNLALHMAK